MTDMSKECTFTRKNDPKYIEAVAVLIAYCVALWMLS